MKTYRIHAETITYLYADIEANSLDEAREKCEEIAEYGGMNEDFDNQGEGFNWLPMLDKEIKP